MKFFVASLFLFFFTLDGFKTWFKPHSIRLTNYALFNRLPVGSGDEYGRQENTINPSKRLLSQSMWKLMYRATVHHCKHYQQLPMYNDTTNFKGHNDLKIGVWVDTQKHRYDGKDNRSLTSIELNKMMAIDEFREWAEDHLRVNDVRWEFMYRATVDYCQQHQRLPPPNYVFSFKGHEDLNLGSWVAVQKTRYDGNDDYSPLTDEHLNKMMAIAEFREWADDPLRDNDVRWDVKYRATVDYCQQHQQLPPHNYTTSYEGHDDLNLGCWVTNQKQRYDGNDIFSPLTDEQLNKMMGIGDFRKWAEDPLRVNDVRWEFMYRATVDYCQLRQRLPPRNYVTSIEGHDDLKLGSWVAVQKQRYDGNDDYSPLTDDQLNKLMAIDEFRKWAEDSLRDNDFRWGLMFRATVDYCGQHQRLPPQNYVTSFEGHEDLILGIWVETQKGRYDGKGKTSLTDEQLNKMMAIDEFREWAEDPLRDNDVRWEFMYQRLLHGNFTAGKYDLYGWFNNQKTRYKGKQGYKPLSDEEKTKLMACTIFREWAEDPLSDANVRWEVHFDLLAEYCYFYHKLPSSRHKAIYERKDGTSQKIHLGGWLGSHKTAYSGVSTTRITEEKHDKLMQIPEFKSWAMITFGTTRYSDFFTVKVRKTGSKTNKSTTIKQ